MNDALDRIRVPAADRWLGGVFARWPGLGRRLSALETRIVRMDHTLPAIERPVYVCGMARAGSTLLLEILHAADGFTTHRYGDYPLLWTPFWWNRLRERLPRTPAPPHERAHGDRIAVNRESPEAFEEVFWQHFFPGRMDPAIDQVLEPDARSVAFDAFYTAHICKLLVARRARRYLAKANCNLTRLGYLHSLFPDMRVIIPIREPVSHVASLLRQDQRFRALAARDSAVGRHLCRVGHREFGPDKRAVNVGDSTLALAIQADFATGDVVRAYAWQWTALHAWLIARLAADAKLARACLLVRHDELCAQPRRVLASVFDHAGVSVADAQALTERFASTIQTSGHYPPCLDARQRQDIERIAGETWHALCALGG